MAATDPESLIQVLSVGVERDKDFPRTNHHLAKVRGIHLLQYGWNWRIWGSPWISHLDGLKPNSHGQSTNNLASEKPSFFWSRASFWATQFLVLQQWKGWGMWKLLEKWGRLCPVLIWWKMSMGPGARNNTMTNTWQWNSGWVCGVGRSIREGCCGGQDLSIVYSQENISGSLTSWSFCQKCEDTKPTSVQSNPFQCPHHSHRLELLKKVKAPSPKYWDS